MILRYLAVFLIVFYYAGYVSYGNQPKDTLDIQQLMLQYQESLRKSKYDKALKDLNVLGDYLIYTELDHKESYHYFKVSNHISIIAVNLKRKQSSTLIMRRQQLMLKISKVL